MLATPGWTMKSPEYFLPHIQINRWPCSEENMPEPKPETPNSASRATLEAAGLGSCAFAVWCMHHGLLMWHNELGACHSFLEWLMSPGKY